MVEYNVPPVYENFRAPTPPPESVHYYAAGLGHGQSISLAEHHSACNGRYMHVPRKYTRFEQWHIVIIMLVVRVSVVGHLGPVVLDIMSKIKFVK